MAITIENLTIHCSSCLYSVSPLRLMNFVKWHSLERNVHRARGQEQGYNCVGQQAIWQRAPPGRGIQYHGSPTGQRP
jgi:hypothetical protein